MCTLGARFRHSDVIISQCDNSCPKCSSNAHSSQPDHPQTQYRNVLAGSEFGLLESRQPNVCQVGEGRNISRQSFRNGGQNLGHVTNVCTLMRLVGEDALANINVTYGPTKVNYTPHVTI